MILLAILILIFGAISHERSKVYAGPLPFWKEVTRRASADKSRAWGEVGAYLKMAGKYVESEMYLKEAIRRNPRFGPAMDNLAWALWDQQKTRQAMITIRICTERCPEYAMGWQGLGAMLDFSSNGHSREACIPYFRALELDPKLHRCLNRVGMWYAREKNYPLALEYCEKARAAYGNMLEYSANTGLLRIVNGDRPSGEQLLNTIPQPIKITSESLHPSELGLGQ